jgi:hypothetical protein
MDRKLYKHDATFDLASKSQFFLNQRSDKLFKRQQWCDNKITFSFLLIPYASFLHYKRIDSGQQCNVPVAVFDDGIQNNLFAGLRSLVRHYYWNCFKKYVSQTEILTKNTSLLAEATLIS